MITLSSTVHEILYTNGPVICSDQDDGILIVYDRNDKTLNVWRRAEMPGVYYIDVTKWKHTGRSGSIKSIYHIGLRLLAEVLSEEG